MVRGGQTQGAKNAWAIIFLPKQTEEAFKKDNAAKRRWLEAGKRAMTASCAVFADLFSS
jgi:hypothetical protein